jgi:hypothetical protein
LVLSFASDRPIAIRGLEKRLIDAFGTTGGLGVFDIYLHRSLLWHRSSDILKPIDEFRGTPVPSWSWMAHDGAISYLNVPFGHTLWSEDIASPFTKNVNRENPTGNWKSDSVVADPPLELQAPVWNLVVGNSGRRIMDQLHRTFAQPIQCVVVGKSDKVQADDLQTHWVLLVYCVARVDDIPVYQRVGVGVLQRRDIAFDEPQIYARIR